MKKKEKKYLVIGILFVLLIAIGITYAYFSAKITGSESSSTISLTAGELAIDVSGGNNITANQIYPNNNKPWATKTITLTGKNTTQDLILPYTLKLVIDQNNFSTNMKYTIEGENVNNNGELASNVEMGNINASGFTTLGSGYFDQGSNKIHRYTLSIYYPETETDQSIDMEKSFNAHIIVEGDKAHKPYGLYLNGSKAYNAEPTSENSFLAYFIINGEEAVASFMILTDSETGYSYVFAQLISDVTFEEMPITSYELHEINGPVNDYIDRGIVKNANLQDYNPDASLVSPLNYYLLPGDEIAEHLKIFLD